MHSERDLIVEVAASWNDKRQVVEYTLAEAVHEREPMRGGKICPRLPFFGTAIRCGWRNPDLHGCFLLRLFQHTAAGMSACTRPVTSVRNSGVVAGTWYLGRRSVMPL